MSADDPRRDEERERDEGCRARGALWLAAVEWRATNRIFLPPTMLRRIGALPEWKYFFFFALRSLVRENERSVPRWWGTALPTSDVKKFWRPKMRPGGLSLHSLQACLSLSPFLTHTHFLSFSLHTLGYPSSFSGGSDQPSAAASCSFEGAARFLQNFEGRRTKSETLFFAKLVFRENFRRFEDFFFKFGFCVEEEILESVKVVPLAWVEGCARCCSLP